MNIQNGGACRPAGSSIFGKRGVRAKRAGIFPFRESALQMLSGGTLLQVEEPGCLLLIDMGTGTTDLVVCKYLLQPDSGIPIALVTTCPRSLSI